MADRFPREGLDFLLGVVPRGGPSPATLWLGLFTSQSPSTVPADSAVLASSSGVTEASGVGYARVAVAASAWSTPTDDPVLGRRCYGPTVTFPTVSGVTWGNINGFFVATAAVAGVALFYANFDDESPILSATNDVISLTPYFAVQP